MTTITLRPLKGKDAKVFARIIGQELAHLPTTKNASPEERRAAGIKLVQGALDRHLDSVWAWLADLAGMTAEELDEEPLDTLPQLVAALAEKDDFQSFLDYVKSLAAKLDSQEASNASS